MYVYSRDFDELLSINYFGRLHYLSLFIYWTTEPSCNNHPPPPPTSNLLGTVRTRLQRLADFFTSRPKAAGGSPENSSPIWRGKSASKPHDLQVLQDAILAVDGIVQEGIYGTTPELMMKTPNPNKAIGHNFREIPENCHTFALRKFPRQRWVHGSRKMTPCRKTVWKHIIPTHGLRLIISLVIIVHHPNKGLLMVQIAQTTTVWMYQNHQKIMRCIYQPQLVFSPDFWTINSSSSIPTRATTHILPTVGLPRLRYRLRVRRTGCGARRFRAHPSGRGSCGAKFLPGAGGPQLCC